MASIPQIRGALLEEAVLFLLEKAGYETIDVNSTKLDSGLRPGGSGLEVRGRGSWHQIDALASFVYSPAFMYPFRLMVEAKCYQKSSSVGIEVVRNSVGILKDISENYFTIAGCSGGEVQVPRFNYHSAIFSTSKFSSGAVEYALAHQIFLIQYEKVPVIQPLINGIMSFDEECLTAVGKDSLSEVRKCYRRALKSTDDPVDAAQFLTQKGISLIEPALVQTVSLIEGSYFGMLQGRWPLHLLTATPLPVQAFKTDSVLCRIIEYNTGEWMFTPLEY